MDIPTTKNANFLHIHLYMVFSCLLKIDQVRNEISLIGVDGLGASIHQSETLFPKAGFINVSLLSYLLGCSIYGTLASLQSQSEDVPSGEEWQ